MKFLHLLLHFLLKLIFSFLLLFFLLKIFNPILTANSLIIPYAIYPFDICKKSPIIWYYLKITYVFCSFFSCILFSNILINLLFKLKNSIKDKRLPKTPNSKREKHNPNSLNLYLGNDTSNNEKLYLCEKSLYQNFLITGTIGSGKTSSAMYPFTSQLINYKKDEYNQKIGMLILDVKGNFVNQVKEFLEKASRLEDLIVIEIDGKYTYNPLDKPNLNPNVLANRLKTILQLFSPETSESYWIDKAEQVISEAIKLCRLYNNGYVNFLELHKLINFEDYYLEKINLLRQQFQSGKLSNKDIYDLQSSLSFFQNEFKNLDSRVSSIIKSEITRITNTFISDYNIFNTFCPQKENINFNGFKDVIESGKVVVLNMNIAKYKNLSKIIATYLKLDFQAEVLQQISNNKVKPTAFICDEYHEYVTLTDADFFAQSRESKCINIVATQSYTSILNTLKDEYCTKAIIQNLINKIWFRTDDSFTIEEAQKQIGKEDKTKYSRSISENAQETNFNYFTNSLNSKNSNLSETMSSYIYSDFVYDTNFFTQNLETFSSLCFLSNGSKILPIKKLKMIPYFDNKQKHKKNKLSLLSDD